MGLFILAVILWAIAVIAAAAAVFAGDEYRAASTALAVLAAVAGAVFFGWGGIKSVPPKSIGVPVSLGKVDSGYYAPGAHWTWTPWLHVADINETVQTTTFEGDNCLTVRIGGQQQACADITIQWQILPQAADSLFSDYANQGDLMTTITDALVIRELKQVVNQMLGDYNPITDVQSVTNTGTATSQFSAFSPAILQVMQADIGSRIKVKNVLLPFIRYDDQVEAKLNAIQQAYANYAIAQENVKVNQEQAMAYQKLGAPTLNALIAECLSSAVQRPVGFQCFPGANSGLALSK